MSALGIESIPNISLGTAALVIFAGCAVIAAVRGFARLMLGVFVIAGACWAGMWTWSHAPAITGNWMPNPPFWFAGLLTTIAALGMFLLLRMAIRTILNPGGESARDGESPYPKSSVRALRVLFSIIPGAVLCFLGAAMLRHVGSVADLRNFALGRTGVDIGPVSAFLGRIKEQIDAALPESWFKPVDPLTDNRRLALAKWITARADGSPEPVIDPATGKPIPRAIIVDDPQLQELARKGRFSEILRDPRLDAALSDPQVRRTILDKPPR